MKLHHIILLILKVSMVIQVGLIFVKVQSENDIVYLISDFLFKTLLGLFLCVFFFINGSPSFDTWDEIFISFGGALLMFDAFYNVLPKLLAKFNVFFNPYTLSVSKTALST